MERRKLARASTWVLIACCVYFLGLGLVLIPHVGVYEDEALFARGIYWPDRIAASKQVASHWIPLMLMSYVGALKCWLYAPWLALTGPSLWTLRLPVLLCGVLTIIAFAWLVDRLLNRRAAVVGAALLATHPPFLFTTVFDWGPVALQQLLFVSGSAFLVKYVKERRVAFLGLSGLLFGLGLWDKALFVWNLSGLVVASLILYGRQLRTWLNLKAVLVALVGVLVGAAPLVKYAVSTQGQTFLQPKHSFRDLRDKWVVFRATLEGTVMQGFMVPPAGAPSQSVVWQALDGLARHLQRVPGTAFGWLLVLAPLAAWAQRQSERARLATLMLLGFAISWLQMLATEQAGGSAHHTILLWPWLVGLVVCGVVSMRTTVGRFAMGALVTLALSTQVAGGLVQTMRILHYGPIPPWDDATIRLAEILRRSPPSHLYVADWGMENALCFLLAGNISIENAVTHYETREPDVAERERILERLRQPGALVVAHVPQRAVFPWLIQVVDRTASEANLERHVVALVSDHQGRPAIEILRYLPRQPL